MKMVPHILEAVDFYAIFFGSFVDKGEDSGLVSPFQHRERAPGLSCAHRDVHGSLRIDRACEFSFPFADFTAVREARGG